MSSNLAAIYDSRLITNGYTIPKEGYCDQPYVVKYNDGSWVCVLTTGKGREGDREQHIISTISRDYGKTWSNPIDIEPPGPPEASWVMPLIVPYGRIYVFYTYNGDNLRTVITDPGHEKLGERVDTLGYFAYKYSDDGGLSWSDQRYYIPVRNFKIDYNNPYGGKIQFFWGVGKPMLHQGCMYMGFAKVGRFGEGFMAIDEGAFLKSDNILLEKDPEKIRWETLPQGDEGLRAPKGPVADEHNLVGLDDGSLYCTYRTVDGYNCHAYSRDGGHTWTPPEYASYTPGGKRIKHPRAANFVRKYANGKYTLWFHNHGCDNTKTPGMAYKGRNPAWLCGGIEKDGYIYWSQPEIVLYDENTFVGMSYPDFIEDNGHFFITETQKTIARVHEIDKTLVAGLWNQFENKETAKEGLVISLKAERSGIKGSFDMPVLPDLKASQGFSIEFWVNFEEIISGEVILDTRNEGTGIRIEVTEKGTVAIIMNDGRTECFWDCDEGLLREGKWHHIVIIVDGGPKIITFLIDGILCDGEESREYGWGRLDKEMSNVSGGQKINIARNFSGNIKLLRIYDRYLRTSEAVGNYRAGF